MCIFLYTLCEVTVMCLTDHTESSGLSEESSLHGDCRYTESHSPAMSCHRVTQGLTCGLLKEQELSPTGRQEWLPAGQAYEKVDDDDEEEGKKNVFLSLR